MNKDDDSMGIKSWKRLVWYRKMGLCETLIFVCWNQGYLI